MTQDALQTSSTIVPLYAHARGVIVRMTAAAARKALGEKERMRDEIRGTGQQMQLMVF